MVSAINTFFCKAILAIFLLIAGNSYAATITANVRALGFVGSPGLPSPDSVNWNFSASGGAATLTFELAGYNTLDGWNNCCTDIFTLSVNGNSTIVGSYCFGGVGCGGGRDLTLSSPASTSVMVNTPASQTIDFTVPINLINGANTITFAYQSPNSYNGGVYGNLTHLAGYQGLSDEGWGINSASVTTTPIPAAIWLTGSALVGLGFFSAASRGSQS